MDELQPFDVRTTVTGDVTVVRVTGYLDLATSPALRRAAQEAVTGGARRLVVDLQATEFIDSTGLGVIVALHKRLPKNFAVVTADNAVRRLFELTALSTLLSLHESTADAVAAVAPRTVTLPDVPLAAEVVEPRRSPESLAGMPPAGI